MFVRTKTRLRLAQSRAVIKVSSLATPSSITSSTTTAGSYRSTTFCIPPLHLGAVDNLPPVPHRGP